jgi:glyoxylase I family protein
MGTGKPEIAGIDHVVLRVRDLEESTRFYVDVLGCTVEKRRDDLGMVHLRAGNSLIDLVDIDGVLGRRHASTGESGGHNMDHLCLSIANLSTEQIRRHLETHGVAVGEVSRRFGASGEGETIYLKDIEGNGIELKGID